MHNTALRKANAELEVVVRARRAQAGHQNEVRWDLLSCTTYGFVVPGFGGGATRNGWTDGNCTFD